MIGDNDSDAKGTQGRVCQVQKKRDMKVGPRLCQCLREGKTLAKMRGHVLKGRQKMRREGHWRMLESGERG